MKKFFLFLSMTVLLCAICLTAVSAADAVVYLADGGTGDGSSADTPVGTLTEAYTALGTEGGTIVLCGTYTIGADVKTPEHTGTATITSVYGEADYRERGANLLFAGTYHLRLQGETLFDNIKIVTKTGTPYVAANFNPITFGHNVQTVNSSGANTRLRVVGGSRDDRTVGALPAGQSSTMEFYSGYYTLFAFSNAVRELTHEGTMYITVGGTAGIVDFWAGIFDSTTSYGGTINLTMKDDAKITNALYMAGNMTGMYLNGDITVNMQDNASISSFKYYDKETLFPNHTRTLNVTGDSVRLPDGYADCFDVITKDGVQVKPEPEVTTLETVYVATGGSGDGSAANKPVATLKEAYALLDPEEGGTIVICGEYKFTASVFPTAHTGKITLTSVYDGVDYRENGACIYDEGEHVLRLSGPTDIDNLNFVFVSGKAPTIAANFHSLKIGEGFATLDKSGNDLIGMRIVGGPYNTTPIPDPLLGDGESSSLEIYGGVYKNIIAFSYSYDSVQTLTHTGTVHITLGNNVTAQNLWCSITNSTVSSAGTVIATLKDNAAITGLLYMGSNQNAVLTNGDITINVQDNAAIAGFKYYDDALFPETTVRALNITGENTSLPTGFGECFDVITKDGQPYEEPEINYDVVFVADGGTGDGTSAETPVATLADAYTLLNDDGGTIVISGEYTVSASATFPAYSGTVTITSVYNSVDFRESGARLYFPKATTMELGGTTVWKDLNLHFADFSVIAANFHPVTFDTGVVMTQDPDEEGVAKSESVKGLYLIGGQNRVSHADETIASNSTITLRSGFFRRVVGFGRYTGNTTYTGTANIVLENDTIVRALYAGANADSATAMNANITLKDKAEIWNLYMGGSSRDNFLNGTLDFQVYGGDIYEIDRCGLHTAVNCNSIFTYDVSTVPDGFPFLAELAWFKTIQTFCERNNTHEYSDPYASEFDASLFIKRCAVCGDIQIVSDIPAATDTTVVFVANGGYGDGSHPALPTDDLESAIQKLAETGGTIVFVGEYTLPVNVEQKPKFLEFFFQEPFHKEALLLTSVYDGVDYREKGAKLVFDDCMSYKLAGPVTFDHIVFDAAEDITENMIVARYNPIVIGTDVKMLRDRNDGYNLTLLGGYRYFRYTDMADMIIDDEKLLIMTKARPAVLTDDGNGNLDYHCPDPAYAEKAGNVYESTWLRSDAMAAFNKMFADMEALGMTLPQFGYAWRGYHQQYDGYTRNIGETRIDKGHTYREAHMACIKHCSMPGDSEHHAGIAFDFTQPGTTTTTNTQTEEWKWLMQNSWKYGIIHRYPNGKQDIHSFVYENWHWRYVGEEYALEFANMNASGDAAANPEELMKLEWCLDEYVAMKYGMFDLDSSVTVYGGSFAEVNGGSYGCDAYTFTGDTEIVIGAGADIGKEPENAAVLGDANGDGKASLLDILLILKHCTNETVAISNAADYNGDMKIDIADALLILRAHLSKGN